MFPTEISTHPIVVAGEQAAVSFSWSLMKIRTASLVLLGLAIPSIAGMLGPSSLLKWLCVLWLLCVALLMHLLSKRAASRAVVLTVDKRGILDRRLMSKRLRWQEIATICPVDIDRSHVVDLKLRWPEITLAQTRWHVRIGAFCQTGYGVPAVTLSMVLLDGNVSKLLDAVAQHRPDLLHYSNRKRAALSGEMRAT